MHVHVQVTKPDSSKAHLGLSAGLFVLDSDYNKQIAELERELKSPRQLLL